MANTVITAANGFIHIVFGESSPMVETHINKNNIAEIEILPGGGVYITKSHNSLQQGYRLSYDGENGDRVDSIGGSAATGDKDLRDRILTLITT